MTQITVRNVDEELHQFLKKQAGNKGTSINRYIIQLLKDEGNQNEPIGQKEIFHDLDSLAGTWNDEMLAEFSQNWQEQRQIDEAMWS